MRKMKIHLGCKLLSRRVRNYSQEWLNVYPGCKSIMCVSRLELMRMAEHTSRLWVTLNAWDENDWGEWVNMPSASELLSSDGADPNHWWEWVNTHPGSEFLSRAGSDQNHWQCLNTPTGSEFLSSLWADWNKLKRMGEYLFREWVPLQCLSRSELLKRMDTHPESESLSSIWADWNHWREWVNIHPESESPSSVWADWNHWQERVGTHPGSESLSSVWAD